MEALQIPPGKRQIQDLQVLKQFTQKIGLMSNKNITNEEINFISQSLKLEHFPADAYVL